MTTLAEQRRSVAEQDALQSAVNALERLQGLKSLVRKRGRGQPGDLPKVTPPLPRPGGDKSSRIKLNQTNLISGFRRKFSRLADGRLSDNSCSGIA